MEDHGRPWKNHGRTISSTSNKLKYTPMSTAMQRLSSWHNDKLRQWLWAGSIGIAAVAASPAEPCQPVMIVMKSLSERTWSLSSAPQPYFRKRSEAIGTISHPVDQFCAAHPLQSGQRKKPLSSAATHVSLTPISVWQLCQSGLHLSPYCNRDKCRSGAWDLVSAV